jgi:membrane protein implicated in regulation of membrane protease activity
MFNDIRFVAAMHTLAVVVAMIVGAAAVAAVLHFGGYWVVAVAFVIFLLYSVYSIMLLRLKLKHEERV